MLTSLVICLIIFTSGGALAWDVAGTPPMGFNTWNLYYCGVDADVLKNTAKAMVDSKLHLAGYEYVNSDDCWMLATRDSQGRQIANPQKFPDGFANVTIYIHSLGLKSGLYTAKGPTTCAGFAASCDHEVIDAKQWAAWGIDYVKDDSCSQCGSYTDNEIYHTMWSAIQSSGRAMVLTVEGDPDDALVTAGGYGNAKRVGHDIQALWMSMVSLVDIGSGLWEYAHNSTDPNFGGWWNDLDMIEIGNGPDFLCGQDDAALARCQAHFTMWTMMKAPLILGNDLTKLDNDTYNVLSNADAISVNQDALGVQARRVAVQRPRNDTLGGKDTLAVVASCDAARASQTWFFAPQPQTSMYTFIVPCNTSDPYQQWFHTTDVGAGVMKNVGTGTCVDSGDSTSPLGFQPCSSSGSQQWAFVPSSGHITSPGQACFDLNNFVGLDVDTYGCKQPGVGDSNQVWVPMYDDLWFVLRTNSTGVNTNMCLAATAGPSGGTLRTKDEKGRELCLAVGRGDEGTWTGIPCPPSNPPKNMIFQLTPAGPLTLTGQNFTLHSTAGGVGWNTQGGASGPWPHTRYVSNGGGYQFTLTLAHLTGPTGGAIMAADTLHIVDDNLVGTLTTGGQFCFDFVTGGMLEVWATPLSGGRIAVAMFNRSPGTDTIVALWGDIGAVAGRTYSVKNVWTGKTEGAFVDSYSRTVPTRSVQYIVLSP